MAMKANYVKLPNSEREPARGARLIAPSDPNERLEVSVRLRRKANPAPTSGEHHLSYQELGDNYGADPADIEKVVAFAQQHQLAVVASNAAKRTVKLSGTVSAFSEAFDVQLGHYQHAKTTYRGRTGSICIPKDLDGIVAGVFGLDSRPFAHPHYKALQPRGAAGAQFKGLSPVTVANLYGFPAGDGEGQTIGIIELGGGFRPSDLATYFSSVGVGNPTVLAASVDQGANSPGADADLEVGLDIEIIGAIAPKAKIIVYFAPSPSDVHFGDAILDAVHDTTNSPSIISISWGGPEDGATGQFIQDVKSALEDAQRLGITVLVASGDNGAADIGPNEWDGKAHVDFPSSSDLVLACGATRIDPSGTTLLGEAAWNQGFADTDPQVDSFGSVGGGISGVTGVPAWQGGLSLPASVNGGGPGRGVPDVTGNGDPSSGYRILVNGQSTVVGGTSAVAPLWAGLIARINQKLGQRVGFVNPALYASPASFNDVKLQSNRVSSQGGKENLGYDATSGWDACTGLGSPVGGKVLDTLTAANKVGAPADLAHA
jgi:kumamolisin